MGGFGSGGYNGPNSLKVEGCRRLCIAHMVKEGAVLPRGRVSGSYRWQSWYYGDSLVRYEANTLQPDNAFLRLQYHFEDEDPMDYTVRLTRTFPHYGGARWWFVCTSTGRRVGMLYLPYGGRKFLSRRAYRLKYSTQGMDAYSRAMRKSEKLQERVIEGEDGLFYKAKGMHQKTFDRIMDAVDVAEAKADRHFAQRAMRLWAILE